jgi:uncharacterized tellurite resistance protein B-like protein
MKEQFEKKRNTKLSDQEFSILILMYPIFSVAISDGTFDKEEENFIKMVMNNFLGEIYGNKIDSDSINAMIGNYIEDFIFISNDHELKENFYELFKSFESEVKIEILNLVNEIASASEGVSEVEKNEISRIELLTH